MSLMRCSILSRDQLEYIVDFGLTADATPALENGFFEPVFDAAFDAVTGAGYHRDATGQLAS